MELDEAIKHCEEMAKEIRQANEEMPTDCKLSKELCECAKEHEQLALWLKELKELQKFAEFVTGEVLDDNFEDCSGAFAEIACRKLVKLGYVKLDGNVYKRGSEE